VSLITPEFPSRVVDFVTVLRRGVVAGAAAGLVAALVLWLVVEPVIREALAIEGARGLSGGQSGPLHGGGHELVSRTQQVVFGALTVVLVGIAVGVVFAVVFAKARHRLPGSTDFSRSVALAGAGFGAVTLLPAVAVPANPPAVGDPATVGDRTAAYVLAILIGVAIALSGPALDRWLASRGVRDANRWALDLLGAAGAIALALAVLPGNPDTVPPDVPASLLWDFRVASLGQFVALWLTLGITFGLLMERGSAPARTPRTVDPSRAGS